MALGSESWAPILCLLLIRHGAFGKYFSLVICEVAVIVPTKGI